MQEQKTDSQPSLFLLESLIVTKGNIEVVLSSSTSLCACGSRFDTDDSYGKPIAMDAFQEEFMSDVEGANKHAVKRLTRTLEVELLKSSVNAPDW
jgi:hypothetical protein